MAAPSTPSRPNRKIWFWALYDIADHAFITTTSSTFFPPYFILIAFPAFLLAGQASGITEATARTQASNVFAFGVSLALLISAILAPIVGAYADITGRRKRILIVATVFGAMFSSAMAAITTGMWVPALLLYIGAQIALNVALGMNSSLLPHVAPPDKMNWASSLGYAMGYFGGGALLAVNTALYMFADKIGLDSSTAIRIAFFVVGIWWLLFTIPMALGVPEPAALPLEHGSKGNAFRDALTRLGHTFRDIQRYRELFKMLIAFWLYSEGIGAIILLATNFGAAIGLNPAVLIGALLMTQFVAFPYALIYGRIPNPAVKARSAYVSMLIWTAVTFPLLGIAANLTKMELTTGIALIVLDQIIGVLFSHFYGAQRFQKLTNTLDTKKAIVLGLVIYTVIPLWGFFLKTQTEFFMIAWLVGTVQGGTQALSRTLYASMTPTAKSGEFFGLYGLSEKFAGILGPLLYGIVGTLTNDPRASVLSISVFFVIGVYALLRVRENEGQSVAQAEDARILELKAAD